MTPKIEFLTPQQAAKRLGLSTVRVQQFCHNGRLGQRVGSRYIIAPDDLVEFAKIPRYPGKPNKKNLFVKRG